MTQSHTTSSGTPAGCQPALLPLSLTDALSELQEDWLATHLDVCPVCRRQLEDLASNAHEWQQVSDVLRTESGTGDAGQPLRSSRIAGSMDGSGVVSGPPGESGLRPIDFAVDFLQPSEHPESLGRLAGIEIRQFIGRGGNGIVLKGFQEELQRLIAVKVMAPQLATSAAARTRFAREARATAAIVHPNVMPVLQVDSSGQLPFLVMPYVDCETLQDRLDRDGSLPVADVLRIALQVARALAAAHAQGLVHRDVKPANILLERGVDRVLLTDFGLARAVDDASLTRSGVIAGTPHYMSPEQARGDAVDTRSDLFSLGSVLYAMCTGRPPFRAETCYGILRRVTDDAARPVRSLNPDIPAWLEGMIQQLLEKSADMRFTTAGELAELLEGCLAHLQQPEAIPLPGRARSLAQPVAVPNGLRRRTRWLLLLGLCAAAVLVALMQSPVNRDLPGQTIPADPAELSARGPETAALDAASARSSAKTIPSENSASSGNAISAETTDMQWDDGIDADLHGLDRELELLGESLTESQRLP